VFSHLHAPLPLGYTPPQRTIIVVDDGSAAVRELREVSKELRTFSRTWRAALVAERAGSLQKGSAWPALMYLLVSRAWYTAVFYNFLIPIDDITVSALYSASPIQGATFATSGTLEVV